eukprot:1928909-Amphidinium_carterae.2
MNSLCLRALSSCAGPDFAAFLDAVDVGVVLHVSKLFWIWFTRSTTQEHAGSSTTDLVSDRRRALVVHVPAWLAKRADFSASIDPFHVTSCELPLAEPAKGSALSLPRCKTFVWNVPATLEWRTANDMLEEEDERHQPPADEGAFRSAAFQVWLSSCSCWPFQLRWFPEGSALCQSENGCSVYALASRKGSDEAVSALDSHIIFELTVSDPAGGTDVQLRRVLCNNFAKSPQW